MTDELFDYKPFLKNLTSQPGVYRMINDAGVVIYVGKAKNLKKRVSSYFTKSDQTPKTRVMVAQIRSIDVTLTHTENEALILESNLIKSLRPQYNVLYRDDKSYPYIYLSTQQDFPRLSYFRGARKAKGRYFGPYPSAGAAKESLNLLQKLFAVRQCEDSFFRNRSRPCLQYQIKRCSGPCVDLVTKEDYREQVRHTEMFLDGKNTDVINELATKMESAAAQMEFEKAAVYRDQIAALRKVQERQYITGEGNSDVDVIATMIKNGVACVMVFFIRGGNNLGSKSFFPKHSQQSSEAELLSAFIAQYYIGKSGGRAVPQEVICSVLPGDREWLQDVLTEQTGRKLVIKDNVRGERARWLKLAII
ncbi:MAG: excinuclease ABC subunit UvrC, partial [Gammaproteobacteria bacterium]|nr:excinuclease ABC subunit UvrC [Gammaproteobacteria bacterium]